VKGTVSLHDIFEKYNEKIQFLMVYIREAHPIDGWWLGKGAFKVVIKLSGSKVALDIHDPTNIEERRKIAGQCEESLKYGIRTYVDEMDDGVNEQYAAWPTRLYLVGLDGKVAYAGGLGPFDFKPAEFEKAIDKYLNEMAIPA
jgi:hypothetical protein